MTKLHLYLHIIFYLTLFAKSESRRIEIRCPEHCKCDIFEKLRRATCTNRNLVIVEANLPQQTQLLDLSLNQISRLNNQVFKEENLIYLKQLNISYNKIGQIEMKAFEGLKMLKTLDLSHNSIRYILKEWFWSLQSLVELYLDGNSFSRLDAGPQISSKSLIRLGLSHCRISFISIDAFTELPNLEFLDISSNLLIKIQLKTINPLTNLNILNADNNTLSCDGDFDAVSSFCTRKGVRFTHSCNKEELETEEKFQKIVNFDSVDEKSSWIYDDEDDSNNTKIIQVCNATANKDKSLLQEIVDLSPILSLIIPFFYGIAVGVLLAYVLSVCTDKKKKRNENTYVSFEDSDPHLSRRNTMRRLSSRSKHDKEETLPLTQHKSTLSESTPVLFRKNQVNF